MTILHRFETNFDQLTSEQAALLAARLDLGISTEDAVSGKDLREIAEAAGMDHADVVMSVATDASVLAVQAIETLVGKPIQRQAAPDPTTGRPSEPRERAARSARQRPARDDPRVVVSFVPNPKRPGNAPAMRYDKWRVGMTVTEAIAAGITPADVAWDTDPQRSYVTLADPDSPEAAAARAAYLP